MTWPHRARNFHIFSDPKPDLGVRVKSAKLKGRMHRLQALSSVVQHKALGTKGHLGMTRKRVTKRWTKDVEVELDVGEGRKKV